MTTLKTGRHLSFPFRVGRNGRCVQVTTLEEHVRDEILQLLLTSVGERLFLPEFGGGLRRLVFEGADESTGTMLKAGIVRALTRWLGHRVAVEDLSVMIQNETVEVELKYRIAGTEDTRVLRFQRTGGSA